MPGIFTGDAVSAWSQYLYVLEEYLGGDQGERNIQPLAIGQPAQWNTDKSNYNRFLQQQMADRMPDWGGLANFAGRWVSEGFEYFLSTIQARVSASLSDEDKTRLEAASARRTNAQEALVRLEKEINYRWKRYRADMEAGNAPVLTRRQFETSRGYEGQRSELKLIVRTANGDYSAIINRVGGGVRLIGQAVEDYYSDYANIPLPESPEEDDESLRDNWQPFKRQWVQGDLDRFLQGSGRVTIELEQGRSTSESFERHWRGRAGISVGWFTLGASAEHQEMESHFKSSTQSVKIGFENLAEFEIYRGRWYKPNLIDLYGSQANGLWGPEGAFNVIPTAYVLAHGTRVEVETNEAVRDYARRHFAAGGTLGIGPFRFGGSHSETQTKAECTVQGTKLVVEDTSGQAHIVAVKSQTPFYSNT